MMAPNSQEVLESEQQSQFKLIPNPASSVFQLSDVLNSDENYAVQNLAIINANGATVFQRAEYQLNQTIDLSNQAPGLYLVRFLNGDKPYTLTLILL